MILQLFTRSLSRLSRLCFVSLVVFKTGENDVFSACHYQGFTKNSCFLPEVLAGDVPAEVPGDALGADKGEDLCVIVI